MENMSLEKQIDDTIGKINNFFMKDCYISQKAYDNFIEKDLKLNELFSYSNIRNCSNYFKLENVINDIYSRLKNHNDKFIIKEIENLKDYFDNMFKEIEPNIKLDLEQRKAILTDEDYSLVVAGAGSGKTTTMAAKTKYLIEKKHINPKKVLLLSFTNKACEELDYRINEEFKLGVEVLTFHKLGMKFIRQIFDETVTICSDNTLYNIISDYVQKNIFPNKKKLRHVMEVFKQYISFDEKALEFDDFDSYFEWSAESLFNKNKDNLKEYNFKVIKNREKNNISIKGEQLKSQAEVKIANFLYLNDISYEYEKKYPYKLEDNRSYLPDFTVYNGELEYYIEYYGLTSYLKNGDYSVDDINMYKNLIVKKKALHSKYKTDLIELYRNYEDENNINTCINILKKELEKRNVKFRKKLEKEIFYDLYYSSKTRHYFKFIRLLEVFITNFKGKGYRDKDFDDLINKENDDITKEQLKIAREIYNYYDKKIHSHYVIDFNDMINYAYWGMNIAKKKNSKLEYDYVIVDEYQDISFVRYQLLKRISKLFNAKIVAVGDDWQAIYSFSGSDVNIFTNFCDLMGYGEELKITNTYRNSQELIDISGKFVLQNENQINKRLHSFKHLNNPVVLKIYDDENANDKINKLIYILRNIYKRNPKDDVLLLGRYKDDIDYLFGNSSFIKGKNTQVIFKELPNMKIEFLTVHSAKGLGFNQVILLNGMNGSHGFPSEIVDEKLIQILQPKENVMIDFPEERRLFYVALTRTKNKVFILVPKTRKNRSGFINEIEQYDNVIIEE